MAYIKAEASDFHRCDEWFGKVVITVSGRTDAGEEVFMEISLSEQEASRLEYGINSTIEMIREDRRRRGAKT